MLTSELRQRQFTPTDRIAAHRHRQRDQYGARQCGERVEIAIKAALGRRTFSLNDFETICTGMGFAPMPVAIAHGIAAGSLPRHHGDPFDRMLIAQARTEGLTLVTSGQAIRRYDVPILD